MVTTVALNRSRKPIALLAGTLSVAILAVAGHDGRERLIVRWHVWRLHSSDRATRQTALEKLVEMKSPLALPHLIRIVEGALCDEGPPSETLLETCGTGGCRRVLDAVRHRDRLPPIFRAIHEIGRETPDALRGLALLEGRRDLVSEGRDRLAFELAWLLSRMADAAEVEESLR